LPSTPTTPNSTARIRNFEIAAKMQTSVADCSILSKEPDHVRKLYGLDHSNKATANYAKRCLMARRLIENKAFVLCRYFSTASLGTRTTRIPKNFADCVK